MSLDKWINGETDSDRLSESGESPVNTIVRDRAENSKSLTCKYYDKENNTCEHYKDSRCKKLSIRCALTEQLEVNL